MATESIYDTDAVSDEMMPRVLSFLAIRDTFRIGLLFRVIDDDEHRRCGNNFPDYADVVRIEGHSFDNLLVSRFRHMKTLATPLFKEDWNEVVLLDSPAMRTVDVRALCSTPLQIALVLTNRLLSADLVGHGLRQWKYLRCRYASTDVQLVNKSGHFRCLTESQIPQTAQAVFRPRFLRVPQIVLLETWLGRKSGNESEVTFGDAFCGIGGASRGAQDAGLKITWAFDTSASVSRHYRQNFPDALFYHTDARYFHLLDREELFVDVLHLSPSCQPFSAMNTAPDGGALGDWHRDSFLACLSIVTHVRPRIVTMEQVPGILHSGKSVYFENFLRGLTELGFSIAWAVLDCAHYGVPQLRQRLILIASCPGQALPEIPEAHPQRQRSVNSFLAPGLRRMEFEGLFRRTFIACNQARRLDGTQLSIADCAAIQSFPSEHTFSEVRTEALRQIGNAVSPELAKRLFRSILRSLRSTT